MGEEDLHPECSSSLPPQPQSHALSASPCPQVPQPPVSQLLTLYVAVQGDHARPLGAAERGVVDVVGQGGGEAGRGRP